MGEPSWDGATPGPVLSGRRKQAEQAVGIKPVSPAPL